MNNLLSGTIGVLIGVIVTYLLSVRQFRKEMRIQSNRYLLENLIQSLEKIYIAQISHSEITDESINVISAFQVVSYEDLKILNQDLNTLKDAILNYNSGRQITLNSTTTSQEEIHGRHLINESINKIMEKIRELT